MLLEELAEGLCLECLMKPTTLTNLIPHAPELSVKLLEGEIFEVQTSCRNLQEREKERKKERKKER